MDDKKKEIHRLLMQKPMISDRRIAETLKCDVEKVREIHQQIWKRT